MKRSQQLLNNITGYLKIPKKYKNQNIGLIIKKAKKEYFTSKK